MMVIFPPFTTKQDSVNIISAYHKCKLLQIPILLVTVAHNPLHKVEFQYKISKKMSSEKV